jgi:hypothetical protein
MTDTEGVLIVLYRDQDGEDTSRMLRSTTTPIDGCVPTIRRYHTLMTETTIHGRQVDRPAATAPASAAFTQRQQALAEGLPGRRVFAVNLRSNADSPYFVFGTLTGAAQEGSGNAAPSINLSATPSSAGRRWRGWRCHLGVPGVRMRGTRMLPEWPDRPGCDTGKPRYHTQGQRRHRPETRQQDGGEPTSGVRPRGSVRPHTSVGSHRHHHP